MMFTDSLNNLSEQNEKKEKKGMTEQMQQHLN